MDIGSDQVSVGQARLTLAEVLAPPETGIVAYSTDGLDSSLPEVVATKEKVPAPFSIKSRDLIREYFAETRPYQLAPGSSCRCVHPRTDEQRIAHRCGRNS